MRICKQMAVCSIWKLLQAFFEFHVCQEYLFLLYFISVYPINWWRLAEGF